MGLPGSHSLGEMRESCRKESLPWVWWRRYYPGIYASLVYIPRCTHPVHTRPVHPSTTTKVFSRPDDERFVRDVNPERVSPKERCLSHPENKPPNQEKPLLNGKETRYRESLCTRTLRMCQPLQKGSPAPPQGPEPPFHTGENSSGHRGFTEGFPHPGD